MKLSRRGFLKTSVIAGGGLLIGFQLSGCKPSPYPNANNEHFQPNAWLEITADNRIILQIHKAEMGQGILTGLTTLVAEELNVSPAAIETQFAGVHQDFINPAIPLQITAGSTSMNTSYIPLREAAATAKTLLLQAAAQTLGVASKQLDTHDGTVYRGDQPQGLLGDFIELAKTLPIPQQLTLKSPNDFQYIGQFNQRLDSAEKVKGTAEFGIDARVKGALIAVLVRCPYFGGQLNSFNATQALKAPGVSQIFAIEGGIAVVAKSYWHARRAAQLLEIDWSVGDHAGLSSADIDREQQQLLTEAEHDETALSGNNTLSAEYSVPLLAHACMEPMNATVAISEQQVDVWTSNQSPDMIQAGVAHALQRPKEQVIVHSSFAGGGFGRRFLADAAIEAALIAQQLGQPVKLIWSREDDIQHDYYRPTARARMSAELLDNKVAQWRYRVCAPSILATAVPAISLAKAPSWLPEAIVQSAASAAAGFDTSNLEAVDDSPYLLGKKQSDYIPQSLDIPVTYWRSVGHSFNGFFVEGFMDELAQQAGTDAVSFRQQHLAADSRERKALDLAAQKANWGSTIKGRYQGVAIENFGNTVCAQVAELSVEQNKIHVHKIVCVVDCGQMINPDIVHSQVESCIIFGLTAALKGEILINDGQVQQSNFHDYPLLRIDEIPAMEIHLVNSSAAPTGVGECAVAPVAPAVANAVFAATGQRLRSLPLQLV